MTLFVPQAELAALCTFAGLFGSDPFVGAIFETLESQEGTLFLPKNEDALALTTLATDTEQIADLLSNHFAPGEARNLKRTILSTMKS